MKRTCYHNLFLKGVAMTTQYIDDSAFQLREPFDFSFLSQMGYVFRVFDQQDSGNICFGLVNGENRYFLKFAGAKTLRYKGDPQTAIDSLQKASRVYRDLAHPTLLRLLWSGNIGKGYGLLFPWTDAMCMGKQYPTREEFLHLPMTDKKEIFRSIMNFHLFAVSKNYVSVDFYDGSILYERETHRTLLCDIDSYHSTPYRNPVGRMWGSSRFMSPEEFEKGAPIDEITMVYTMGATAFALFAREGMRDQTAWPLGESSFSCATKAVSFKREERFQSLSAFSLAWEKSLL